MDEFSQCYFVADEPSPPKIDKTVMASEYRIPYMGSVNLTCKAMGNPAPQVWWSTDHGINFDEPKNFLTSIGFKEIDQSRFYVCNALNDLGRVSSNVSVVIIEPPQPPRKPRIRAIGSSYVEVEWVPSESPNVDSYTIVLKPERPSSWSGYDPDFSDLVPKVIQAPNLHRTLNSIPPKTDYLGRLSHNVTNLQPHTNYSFVVKAIGTEDSPPSDSETQFFITEELPPGSTPRAFHGKAIKDDTVSLEWKPPAEPNGIITSYKLYYSTESFEAEAIKSSCREQVISGVQTSTTIHGLVYKQIYYMRIRASNKAGDGPLSELLGVIVAPGIPTSPTNLQAKTESSSRINLFWQKPEMEEQQNFLGYVLKYKADKAENSESPTSEISVSALATAYSLQNLEAGTTYVISLAGKSPQGVGVAAHVKQQTFENVEMKLFIRSLTSHAVELCWLRNLTVLAEAAVNYQFELTSASSLIIPVPVDTCCCFKITSLVANFAYHVKLQAFIRHNASLVNMLDSPVLSFETPPPAVPTAPKFVSIQALNSSAVEIVFQAPEFQPRNVDRYLISWQEDSAEVHMYGQSEKKDSLVPGLRYNQPIRYTIRDLQASTVYRIMVRGENIHGLGKPLIFERIETPETAMRLRMLIMLALSWQTLADVEDNLFLRTVKERDGFKYFEGKFPQDFFVRSKSRINNSFKAPTLMTMTADVCVFLVPYQPQNLRADNINVRDKKGSRLEKFLAAELTWSSPNNTEYSDIWYRLEILPLWIGAEPLSKPIIKTVRAKPGGKVVTTTDELDNLRESLC
ncbi:hypothetical protein Ciccas_000827 [Cichlidogyrus casuarinus]|uniref:Uncharacterized protein n=1 Tax=Cichlidogyrus casuarinus TaxID=1844966 RepID=A0ABD2QLT5_9PLAT